VLYFELDDVLLRVLGKIGETYPVGEKLWVKFNEEKMHLIDENSGKVLI